MQATAKRITGEIRISERGLKEIQEVKDVLSHQEKIKTYLGSSATEL